MIGYMAELGVERTLWAPGASRLELTLTEDHLNKGGVAHGGIHMMLLDSALGSALVASLKVEEWCATAQLSTIFLAAARCAGDRRRHLVRRLHICACASDWWSCAASTATTFSLSANCASSSCDACSR